MYIRIRSYTALNGGRHALLKGDVVQAKDYGNQSTVLVEVDGEYYKVFSNEYTKVAPLELLAMEAQ